MTAAEMITAATARLVCEKPFFGSLRLRLEVVVDHRCKSGWTDGTHLGYNPAWVSTLTMPQVVGFLIHEVLHCAFLHHTRRGTRDLEQWNVATDYVINPVVLDCLAALPAGALLDAAFAGMSAEAVYAAREQKQQEQEQQRADGQGGGAGGDAASEWDEDTDEGGGEEAPDPTADAPEDTEGSENESSEDADDGEDGAAGGKGAGDDEEDAADGGQGGDTADETADEDAAGQDPGGCGEVRDAVAEDGTPADPQQAEAEWRVYVAQAATQAAGMGKMSAGLKATVDKILNPEVPWADVLRDFVERSARNDYSMMPPNRRYIHKNLCLPSLSSNELPPVVLGIDTSGSCWDSIPRFCKEVSGILEAFDTTVFVVYCDDEVCGEVQELTREDLPITPDKLQAGGGGGTSFVPVFEWVERSGLTPSCLIYITDLDGTFPTQSPDFPVLWVATTRRVGPFGETVRMGQGD